MADYKQVGNYVLFEEVNPDSIGKNFRAGELENQKIKNHFILSEVHPMLYSNPKFGNGLQFSLKELKNLIYQAYLRIRSFQWVRSRC